MARTPNLRHLRLFSLTARHRSGRRAADEVHLSQPAVAQAIASLEKRAGCQLFERRTTGMFLTPQGRTLCTRVDHALGLLAQASNRVAAERGLAAAKSPPIDRLVSAGQLSALVAVVRNGGFSSAAAELGQAQSSIHRAARSFEHLVGEPIFRHVSSGIEPTRLGADLANIAGRALREIELAFEELGSSKGTREEQLRIGALPLAQAAIVPSALVAASERFPGAVLSVMDGPYPTLLTALRLGDIDVIIGALRDPAPANDVVEELLFLDRRFVVCRAGHPLAKRRQLEVSDLAPYDWAVPRKGTALRSLFDSVLGSVFSKQPRMIETDSFAVLRGLLRMSDALAFVSRRRIAAEGLSGELALLPVALDHSTRPIGLTMRRDWRPSRLQASLVDTLRAAALAQS